MPGELPYTGWQPASLKRRHLCWDLGEETREEMGQGFLSRGSS